MRLSNLKTAMVLLSCTFFLSTLFAQSPEKMSYQAVIRNSSDQLISNKAVGMQITIVQGTASGSSVYTETQSPTTNANGLVSIEIGAGTVQNGNFASIDWSAGPYFIKTQTDPAGGSNYTITGTSQLLSTPYALYAKKAGGMTEIDPIYTASEAANITAPDITNLSNLSGINTGDQNLSSYATKNMANQKITNLATPVNPQDAATKAYVDALQAQIKELQFFTGKLVKDIDGNIYNTVTIGTQVWMAENLKTTKYKDGTAIPLITSNSIWSALTTPAYCWYDNDSATYAQTYGALYNWYTVNIGKLCPTGWHVPSNAEWTELGNYLGGDTITGGKLKEIGTTHWNSPNTGATNETGFTALPAGYRVGSNGTFLYIGSEAYWWSTTEVGSSGWNRYVHHDNILLDNNVPTKKSGFSVRCIKD